MLLKKVLFCLLLAYHLTSVAFVKDSLIDCISVIPVWVGQSDQANAYYGWNVATAGDVNGDGYSDVIVGAVAYNNGQGLEGRTYVYFGGPAGLEMSPAWTVGSSQKGANLGNSVASAGDVNGDGFSDIIVAAGWYDSAEHDEGRVYVYLGGPLGLATSPAWTAESNQADSYFGWSVATAGDVNGDGYSDIIIGAPCFTNGQRSEGRSFLYLGSESGLSYIPAWTAEIDQEGANFGNAVASAGDVNGDGYSDVIVGANNYDNDEVNEGAAFVYFGSATGLSTTASCMLEGNMANAWFGTSLETAGDVNSDGYSDVIVGAYGYTNDQDSEGRACVYFGSSVGLSTSPDWTAEDSQDIASFGYSVGTAGDINNDGYSDVIIGARGYNNVQYNAGRTYIYFGSAFGLATSSAWTVEGDQDLANLGFSVATAGDVNGDGASDVIVGAFTYDSGEKDEGTAFLYLGSTVAPPTVTEMKKLGNPFRITINGSNFQNGAKVFLNNVQWTNVKWKDKNNMILKGGASLKAVVKKNMPINVRIINPCGGETMTEFQWP